MNLHKGRKGEGGSLLSLSRPFSPSLSLSLSLLSFSRPFFFLSSVVLFLLSFSRSLPSFSSFSLSLRLSSLFLSSLSSSLSSVSARMTMITRPLGSLCTHGSDLPECQSACTLAPSLFDDYVRIMQETTVLAQLCKPHATWNEVGLYVCWKWVMCLCLVVLACVSMCCLRCVVGCLSVGVDALVVVW